LTEGELGKSKDISYLKYYVLSYHAVQSLSKISAL
jgi:hypothetical protein